MLIKSGNDSKRMPHFGIYVQDAADHFIKKLPRNNLRGKDGGLLCFLKVD